MTIRLNSKIFALKVHVKKMNEKIPNKNWPEFGRKFQIRPTNYRPDSSKFVETTSAGHLSFCLIISLLINDFECKNCDF